MNNNFYKILDVDKTASSEDIKKAYRQGARKYHPDVCKENDCEQKFKELSAAYEVLSDPVKRAEYDKFGRVSSKGPSPDFGGGFGFDVFNSFFKQKRNFVKHLETIVNISFEEAFDGCKKKLVLERHKSCDKCSGKGSSSFETCHFCSGKGRILIKQAPFHIETICGSCNGSGNLPKDKCDVCTGIGKIKEEDEMIEISIPPGTVDGLQLRISGKGENGENGQVGDLYVNLRVEEHPDFVIDGIHLFKTIDVSYTQLVLGAEVTVENLKGDKLKVRIPAGTEPFKKLRLKGQGWPVLQDNKIKGDLFVVLTLNIPSDPTEEQKELLEKLDQIS